MQSYRSPWSRNTESYELAGSMLHGGRPVPPNDFCYPVLVIPTCDVNGYLVLVTTLNCAY